MIIINYDFFTKVYKLMLDGLYYNQIVVFKLFYSQI